ncbi:MAG: alpha-glucosidase C-terminal domain-containing protein, partial [Ignavibacteriaceae bacterium]
LPGMPLIYNGQEAGLNKRLNFFEKDPVDWKPSKLTRFFETLTKLKKDFTVLNAGNRGGTLEKVVNNLGTSVFSFIRENENEKILVVVNLSNEKGEFTFKLKSPPGNVTELFSKKETKFGKDFSLSLAPWDYKIFTQKTKRKR